MDCATIFSTPIWRSEYPNFEEERNDILESVRDLKNQFPENSNYTNKFGYQSPNNYNQDKRIHNLLNYIGEMCVNAAEDMGLSSVDLAITSVWANINDNHRAMNIEHIHGDTFSGVFYLKCTDESGKLVLSNPGINKLWSGISLVDEKNQFNSERITITPKEGMIVIYPSYVPHSVLPNEDDEERISISFTALCLPEGSLYNENPNE